MKSPTVHILLPVYNRKNTTLGFIQHLNAQTYTDIHLILIDDGSTDGTAEACKNALRNGRISILKGDGNLWWAGGLQMGFDELLKIAPSDDDIVLIINDDVAFQEDFLAKGLSILQQHSKSVLFATNQILQNGVLNHTVLGIHVNWKKFRFNRTNDKQLINAFPSRGLFLSWGDFKEIGGFYPKKIKHYISDIEFTYRAYKKGFSLIINEELYLNVDGEQSNNVSNIIDFTLPFPKFKERLFHFKWPTDRISWTRFILMSCPWYLIPVNLLRLWGSTLLILLKYFIKRNRA